MSMSAAALLSATTPSISEDAALGSLDAEGAAAAQRAAKPVHAAARTSSRQMTPGRKGYGVAIANLPVEFDDSHCSLV
jgi:hypothetical protein